MKVKKGPKVPKNAKFVTICCKTGKNNGNESLQNISALQYTFMSHRPLKTVLNHNIHRNKELKIKMKIKIRPQNDQKMPNFSLFVAKLEKINGNGSLLNISAPQYTFMSQRPLKTGYNHNIHCYKGPEIKFIQKKAPKGPKNAKFTTICRKVRNKQWK